MQAGQPGIRGGDYTKVPMDAKSAYTPGGIGRVKTNDPETWATFAEAQRPGREFEHGIGFVLQKDLGIVGIDIDHCLDGRKITPWARKVVNGIDSYFEVSPSGTGVRGFVFGDIPKALKRSEQGLELYKHVRFLTITGNRIGSCRATIEPRHNRIMALYDAFKPPEPIAVRRVRTEQPDRTDDELIRAISDSGQGAKFDALMNGNTLEFGIPSEADMSLACILCWWSNDDHQVESVMRSSRLARDKWKRASTSPMSTCAQP